MEFSYLDPIPVNLIEPELSVGKKYKIGIAHNGIFSNYMEGEVINVYHNGYAFLSDKCLGYLLKHQIRSTFQIVSAKLID